MLVVLDEKALLVECKYSLNAQTVARDGYEQAVTYAAEVATVLAPQVLSIVVGPDEVVEASHRATLSLGKVGIVSPSDVDDIVGEFLSW